MIQEITPFSTNQLENALRSDPRLASGKTRRRYLIDLKAFEAWRDGRVMTKRLVEEYVAELRAQGKSAAAINRALAAIRWWARRNREMVLDQPARNPKEWQARQRLAEQAARVANVKYVRGASQQPGRPVIDAELHALLETCKQDTTPAGVRDCALLALAIQTGANRSEIVGIDISDLDVGRNETLVWIRNAKDNRTRKGYLYSQAHAALKDWLALRGSRPGPLFCPITKGGRLRVGSWLNLDSARQILNNRIKEAGVTSQTWHEYRQRFAGNLINGEVDS